MYLQSFTYSIIHQTLIKHVLRGKANCYRRCEEHSWAVWTKPWSLPSLCPRQQTSKPTKKLCYQVGINDVKEEMNKRDVGDGEGSFLGAGRQAPVRNTHSRRDQNDRWATYICGGSAPQTEEITGVRKVVSVRTKNNTQRSFLLITQIASPRCIWLFGRKEKEDRGQAVAWETGGEVGGDSWVLTQKRCIKSSQKMLSNRCAYLQIPLKKGYHWVESIQQNCDWVVVSNGVKAVWVEKSTLWTHSFDKAELALNTVTGHSIDWYICLLSSTQIYSRC